MQNIKDPFNDEVNYSYDKTGRLASIIGGTTFAGTASYPYLSSVNYRAFGVVKDQRTYDSRMRLSGYTGLFAATYQYDLSSRLTFAQLSGTDPYNQSFSYDGIGRATGVSTPEMNVPSQYVQTISSPPNGLPSGLKLRPFTASISYDEFGNMTDRSSKYWNDFSASGHPSQGFQTTYENGRAKKDGVVGRVATNGTNQTWTYNAEGEIVGDGSTTQQYDVTGQLVKTQSNADANVYSNHTHDGDGRQVKFEQKLQNPYYSGGYEVITRYRVFSSVTGKLLTEIDATGQKIETHVYALDGEYRQMKAYSIKISGTQFTNYPEQIVSEYGDPKGTQAHQWDRQTNTYRNVHMSPIGVANLAIDWQQVKNQFVSGIISQLAYAQAQAHYPGTRSQLEDPTNPGTGCELDGKSLSCAKLVRQAIHGGIDNDSVIIYGAVQGNGYGGGKYWDDSGDKITETGNVIASGDTNGDLVLKNEAKLSVEKFLERSPGCRELLEKLLQKGLKDAKFFDTTTDNPEFDKSLYQWGGRASSKTETESLKKSTVRNDASENYAITVSRNIFIGQPYKETNRYNKRLTHIHEIVHVGRKFPYQDFSHIELAKRFGFANRLKKDASGKIIFSNSNDSLAGNLLDDWLIQDCSSNFKPGLANGEVDIRAGDKLMKQIFQ